MKFNYKTALTVLLLTALPLLVFGQSRVPMAGLMRSNGKIYVVVAVLVIIFIGILLFLINLDKRLRKLEKNTD